MGKRELLLIAAFVLVGVVVYHATAPPPKAGGGGFSIGAFISRIRSEIKGENAEAEVNRKAQLAVPPAIKRVHVPDYRGTVTVIGEDRDDVVGELRGTAYGMDDEAARGRAKAITLTFEPRAEQIVATVMRPDEAGRQPRFDLTLRMPKALACSLGARGQMEVRGIAELKLLEARGKVTVREVGLVGGDLSNGTIDVMDAREIALRTDRSDVKIERVSGTVTLNARRGQVRMQHVGGEMKLELERVEAEIDGLSAPAAIEARSGQLIVRQITAPVEVDGTHVEVELVLEKAVAITASTSDNEMRVRLGGNGATIDAIAKDGDIRIADHTIAVTTNADNEQHVAAPVNGGGPTLRLRNERGAIVIR